MTDELNYGEPSEAVKDISNSIEDQIKDIRAIFFSLMLVSVFSALTVLSLADVDYITKFKIVRLPIFSVDIPLMHFVIVAPLIMFGLYVSFFILSSRLRHFQSDHSVKARFIPIYFRWFAEVRDTQVGARTKDVSLVEMAASSFMPVLVVSTFCLFWWEVILLHRILLSLVMALLFASAAIIYLYSILSFLQEPMRRRLRLMGVCVVVLAAVFTKVTLDKSGIRLPAPDHPYVNWLAQPWLETKGASLRGAAITQLDDAFVHRYAWVRQYDSQNFNGKNAQGNEQVPEFESEWPDVRRLALGRLRKPDLAGADFVKADLRDAILVGVDANGGNFTGANLDRAQLEGAKGFSASFAGANLWRTRMEGVTMRSADFIGVEAPDLIIPESDLREARMTGGKLFGANFDVSNLRDAKLQGAKLRGASFRHANLIGANFNIETATQQDRKGYGLVRPELKLERTDLTDADFDHALLIGADLRNVIGLTKMQLSTAYLGDDPMLPENLKRELPFGKRCVEDLDELRNHGFPYPTQWWMDSDEMKLAALCRNMPRPGPQAATSPAAGVEADRLPAGRPAGEAVLHRGEEGIDQDAHRGDHREAGEDQRHVEP